MKPKEWAILGFLFQFLGTFFIQLDSSFSSCMQWGSDTCIILSEIYDPFIWAFQGIAVIFWIMAIISWLDNRADKKSKLRHDLIDIQLDSRKAEDREFLLKTAENLGIKQIPHEYDELVFYAKKIGKEKEAKNVIDRQCKKQAKWYVEEAPKQLRKWEKM